MDDLIIDLFNKKILIFNNNVIHTNFQELILYPYLVNIICNFIYDKIKFLEYNSIIGISDSAKHISSILSVKYNIPLLMYSKKRNIYGNIKDDLNTILINDCINDDLGIIKYVNLLKSNKINLSKIFVLYSNNCNISNLIYLFDKVYLIKLLQIKNKIPRNLNEKKIINIVRNLIKQKKTSIGYECNLTNIKDIITKVDNIGSKIIFLKICSNKIDDFNIKYGNALNKLAKNHKFFIIDDLGIYNKKHNKIENWCNFITTYNNKIEYDSDINYIYINDKNNKYINDNIFGVIGNVLIINSFNISNTINNTFKLKDVILLNYDIIMINDDFCNNKIIDFINKNKNN